MLCLPTLLFIAGTANQSSRATLKSGVFRYQKGNAMDGYIFIDHKGNRLTHAKWWFDGQGWVWTEQEKDEILAECSMWKRKPAFIQKARVYDDYTMVETIGGKEKVTA
jgi:hypothetical protein